MGSVEASAREPREERKSSLKSQGHCKKRGDDERAAGGSLRRVVQAACVHQPCYHQVYSSTYDGTNAPTCDAQVHDGVWECMMVAYGAAKDDGAREVLTACEDKFEGRFSDRNYEADHVTSCAVYGLEQLLQKARPRSPSADPDDA